MTQHAGEKRYILKMLWGLIVIAIAGGVLTIGVIGMVLGTTRSNRQQIETEKARITKAVTALRQSGTEAYSEVLGLLDAHHPHLVHSERDVAKEIPLRSHEADLDWLDDQGPAGAVRASIDQSIVRWERLWHRAVDWRGRYLSVHRQLRHENILGKIRSLIAGMQSSLTSIEGGQRIREALLLRRLRTAPAAEIQGQARGFAEQILSAASRTHATLRSDLAELSLLIEVIAAEDEDDLVGDQKTEDLLVDLKDNRLKPLLERIAIEISDLHEDAGADSRLDADHLEQLRAALLGEGYQVDTVHQTIKTGRGGLYNLRRALAKLYEERDALRGSLQDLSADLNRELVALGQLADQRTLELAGETEADLASSWRKIALAAALIGIVFVTLGCLMTRAIHRQVALLRRSQEEALEAARCKSEFLATMSHEIRTPMNGVIGMTSILLETGLTDVQREYAGIIKNSGDSLLAIINDILDFSKIEAGKIEFEAIDFDPGETAEDVVELLAGQALDKGIDLAADAAADLPRRVRGDPGRLRQILINLVGNAIKFTPRGEVVLRLSPAHQDGDDHGRSILFEVIDTGVGIPPERCADLFKPFTQADASTTRCFGGTGLGLAISSRLVELMGGKMQVESTPREGSRFWFVIPFEAAAAGGPSEFRPRGDLSGLRACIVDDNATNRRIVEAYLEAFGMESRSAPDGATALELLRSAPRRGERFDLALLDLDMPEMDGIELARAIKSDKDLASLPLVLLTSISKKGEAAEAREAGFEAWLTKPIRRTSLQRCLAQVLGRRGEETAGGAATPAPSPLARQAEASGENDAKTVPRARILVVEDNLVNQKVALKMLGLLGYDADLAENGRQALEALARRTYDAVLMDCLMPEMDGYEATAAIRQREGSRRHTPIIAMTANAMLGDRDRCLEAGMDDYITKPVARRSIKVALERWIPATTTPADQLPQ